MPPRRAPALGVDAPYPLYTTTYTLHKLSPLHTEPFTSQSLTHHSRTFRDLLAGDTLRGVRIALDDETALSKVGALKSVVWKLLGTPSEFENAQNDDSELGSSERGSRERELYLEGNGRGVTINITYERAEYVAILLRHSPEDLSIIGSPELGERRRGDIEGFQHYPVMASRMPISLRNTLVRYLADSFDTHTSSLNFSTSFLVGTLDTFLDRIYRGLGDNNGARITKDVLVTFSFAPLPTVDGTKAEEDGDIRAIDVTISKEDVAQFLVRGRKALQALSRSGEKAKGGAFWTALSHYARNHLAMDVNHSDVRVAKVACGAFVLGREGRMKVFGPGSLGGGGQGEDANAVEAAEEIWGECVEEVVERVVSAAETGVLS